MSLLRSLLDKKTVGPAFKSVVHYPEVQDFSNRDHCAVHQYQRRLPHWEYSGSTYFLTFRIARRLQHPLTLTENHEKSPPADIVEEALWFHHGERYALDGYVIMPDHVHLIIKPIHEWSLSTIMKGIKGYTAWQINAYFGRRGILWQSECFDHILRNGAEWFEKLNYIHDNPVKAGLVLKPQDYAYSSFVTLHSAGRLESLPHKTVDP